MAETKTSRLICSVTFVLYQPIFIGFVILYREIVFRQILITKYFVRVALNALALNNSKIKSKNDWGQISSFWMMIYFRQFAYSRSQHMHTYINNNNIPAVESVNMEQLLCWSQRYPPILLEFAEDPSSTPKSFLFRGCILRWSHSVPTDSIHEVSP